MLIPVVSHHCLIALWHRQAHEFTVHEDGHLDARDNHYIIADDDLHSYVNPQAPGGPMPMSLSNNCPCSLHKSPCPHNFFFKTFMVLHLVFHTSARNSFVKSERRELERKYKTLPAVPPSGACPSLQTVAAIVRWSVLKRCKKWSDAVSQIPTSERGFQKLLIRFDKHFL